VLADTATNIAPHLAWADRTLFYVGKDAATLREDRVMRHVLGGTHDVVYREADGAYYVGLALSKSKRYIVIDLWATDTTEVRLVDVTRPHDAPSVFLPRSPGHYYEVDHVGERFVMRTNEAAPNYRLVEVPAARAAERSAWKELVAHRADTFVESFALYDTFIALDVRSGGLRRVRVLPTTGAPFELAGDDPSYAMTLDDTPDPRSTRVRYAYDSLTTPHTIYEVDVAAAGHPRTLLERTPVPTYDPSRYASEYLHATAPDGARVPISVVYRKDTRRDGTAPLIVTGYGAYGDTYEPELDLHAISMLDRGWVVAIAHVRGGQELGRAWYEAGRRLAKRNTFIDFITATEHLVAHRYGARDQVFAIGGSAGGLLMGAIANLRPDLYRGIAALVPFVDVVTTMLDESIPLTTNELDEWGDPRDAAAYAYMLGYSPYDNVTAQAYPSIYVRAGLWDSQVQYFEPAKWVAKLRATKTDHNLVVFEVDLTAGHSGASGRFDRLREWARVGAYFLHVKDRPDQRRQGAQLPRE
jgi:oligopeptidase B